MSSYKLQARGKRMTRRDPVTLWEDVCEVDAFTKSEVLEFFGQVGPVRTVIDASGKARFYAEDEFLEYRAFVI